MRLRCESRDACPYPGPRRGPPGARTFGSCWCQLQHSPRLNDSRAHRATHPSRYAINTPLALRVVPAQPRPTAADTIPSCYSVAACLCLDVANVHFPFVSLLLSGLHCQLLVARGVARNDLLGGMLDDALGEAYDKACWAWLPAGWGWRTLQSTATRAPSHSPFPWHAR